MGLVISNALASGLGPSNNKGIMLESKEGVGSKFSFVLFDHAVGKKSSDLFSVKINEEDEFS